MRNPFKRAPKRSVLTATMTVRNKAATDYEEVEFTIKYPAGRGLLAIQALRDLASSNYSPKLLTELLVGGDPEVVAFMERHRGDLEDEE